MSTGIAAAAVLALALTGCGSNDRAASGASESAGATTSAAASASDSSTPETGGDSTARQEYLDAVRAAAEQENTSVRTRSVSTANTPQGRIETTVTGVTVVENGQISARLDTELPQGQGTARTLIVDGAFYVQAPSVPEGKYLKIDLAQAPGQLGEQLQQQLDQIDPRKQAEATVASVKSVEDLGEGNVNGVDVTRYRVTQDFGAFAESQDNPLFDQLLQTGAAPGELTSEVALDDEGRVRRVKIDLDVQGTAVRTVADYLEYDVEAKITAPPKSKVVQSPIGG